MDIVMLGHSNVGKTTYIASMYQQLQTPVNGFSLRTNQYADHKRLLEMAERIQRGVYPAPTDQRHVYYFHLCFEDAAFFRFIWRDYRGGSLLANTDDSQAAGLLRDLRRASGIVVFLDHSQIGFGSAAHDEIGRITYLLSSALSSHERVIPVAIALTKSDLVDSEHEDIGGAAQSLIDAVNDAETTVTATFPIACCEQSRNVALPVLFQLGVGIARQTLQLSNTLDEQRAEQAELSGRVLSLSNFGRWLQGAETYGSLANAAAEQCMKTEEQLAPLVKPASELTRYFVDYLHGQDLHGQDAKLGRIPSN